MTTLGFWWPFIFFLPLSPPLFFFLDFFYSSSPFQLCEKYTWPFLFLFLPLFSLFFFFWKKAQIKQPCLDKVLVLRPFDFFLSLSSTLSLFLYPFFAKEGLSENRNLAPFPFFLPPPFPYLGPFFSSRADGSG